MKTALLFAGQGGQFPGMGKDFYDACPSFRHTMDRVPERFDIRRLCFEGSQEELSRTENTQISVCALSLSIAALLNELGLQWDCAAGLSLGEYSALCAAGAIPFEDLFDLVARRGILMAQALPAEKTGMMAVIAPDLLAIEKVCARYSTGKELCVPANFNSPRQIVLTGTIKALEQAGADLKQNGMRCIRLAVSGAFHSPLLKPAAQTFYSVLESIPFRPCQKPVYLNVSAQNTLKVHEPLPNLLARQMYSPVLFEKSVRAMIEDGVDCFIEIGPGKSLSRLVRQIDRSVKSYCVETLPDLEDLVCAEPDLFASAGSIQKKDNSAKTEIG